MSLGMLGKYERLDVLGHGASGIVYLAKDTLLGKLVAIKHIAAQGEDRDRFLEEARVLDRLRHPNIVQVNSVDMIDGKVVLDMEYVAGSNLQDVLRRTPQLPVADAVGIAAQICDGLAFAHTNRTVHRDVKPANIIISHEGDVKLVDFGLAEVLGTNSFAGGAGTFAYMAPEDFHAEELSDRQSDIWAAGVILYEMLSGRRPFRVAHPKDPFAWKRAVDEDPYTPITQERPEVPAALDRIAAKALAREKRERYADAAEMARDLRALGLAATRSALAEDLSASSIAGTSRDLEEPTIAGIDFRAGRAAQAADEDGEMATVAAGALPGFAFLPDIDAFLALAPEQWDAARAALRNGSLAQWLRAIGEIPLAATAEEIARDLARDPDDALRDFLYRAGLDTSTEARNGFEEGSRRIKEGQFAEAAGLLRRSTRLDPSRPAAYERLAHALRTQGDASGALQVLEEAVTRHPGDRVLSRELTSQAGARLTLSAQTVSFGVMRQGEKRTQRVLLRNAGTGVIQGRVGAAPGWVEVEPRTFTTRQRQQLVFTAHTENVWQTPAEYHETVVLETSAGRHEVTVQATVLPARLGFAKIFYWYIPVLICALLPLLAGLAAPHTFAPGVRHLWEPGAVASGLLCGSLFVLATAADTVGKYRLIPLLLLSLSILGATAIGRGLGTYEDHAAREMLVRATPPIFIVLVMQVVAQARDPRGWGRWPIWALVTCVVGAAVASVIAHG
jgi:tetratricopeptide (TPR) repeat protein/predicted Ser/Thr protein kinase